jgi:hypothetical protein
MSTSILGLGLSPLGTSLYGYGSVATADEREIGMPFILADGTYGTGRFIDATTGDYKFDPITGMALGLTTGQQAVYLALKTIRGSANDPTLGQSFSQVRKIGTNFVQAITNQVNLALQPLVSKGLITIDAVLVDTSVRPVVIDIRWIDNSTNKIVTNRL